MQTRIKPRRTRVLVEIDDSPEVTMVGNIEIVRLPDKDGDRKVVPVKGAVIAVGPEVSDVGVGDYVILDKYHGVVIPSVIGSPSLVLVKEAFVMLVVEGGKDGE